MPAGRPSDASIFNMDGAFMMRQSLNACQSAKTIVIEAIDALISVMYFNFSSRGSSCSVSNVVPIINVYSSA